MLVHRDDVKERRYLVNIDHFYEANKFLIPICADKFTSIQVCGEFSPNRFNVFARSARKAFRLDAGV